MKPVVGLVVAGILLFSRDDVILCAVPGFSHQHHIHSGADYTAQK